NNAFLNYEPNGRSALGFEGSYKWLSAGFSFKLPIADKSVQKYGHTESFDLQFNFNLRRVVIDLYFQVYSGFYLSNMDDYFNSWNFENHYPKTDLSVLNLGIMANYVYNYKKFSYKAALNLTERQNKSAGSFITGGYFFLNQMHSDSTIVPSFAAPYFQGILGLQKIGTVNIGFLCGYTFTFVLNDNFFINLGLTPGFGLYSINAIDRADYPINFDVHSAIILQTRFSFIYQKERFFMALIGVYGTQTSLGKSDYSVSFGHGHTKFSVGYRFDFPDRILKYRKNKLKNNL
ncbi:MAG: DUF4421 family protein, partial [Salinivirgaceae bacterium]|nr:DUF4421 family protein [Salinivirgaceae bacterium]